MWGFMFICQGVELCLMLQQQISRASHFSRERYNEPKLSQETDNLNRPISINKIDVIINDLHKRKAPGSDGFNNEFYQTFSTISSRKQTQRKTLPNLFYEASFVLVPKPEIIRQVLEQGMNVHFTTSIQHCIRSPT